MRLVRQKPGWTVRVGKMQYKTATKREAIAKLKEGEVMQPEYEQITITIPAVVLSEVDRRGRSRKKWRSTVIGRDLGRYYGLLRHTLNCIPFTRAEVMLLCDALNGAVFMPDTISALSSDLATEFEVAMRQDRLDEKWGVNKDEFVARLKGLTRTEALAVIDSVEAVWEDVAAGTDMETAIRRVFNVTE